MCRGRCVKPIKRVLVAVLASSFVRASTTLKKASKHAFQRVKCKDTAVATQQAQTL